MHAKHIEAARATARRLGDESAATTEEGIRDLVDDDGEGEAAARTVLVRQAAARAMYAFRRVRDLEAGGEALAFGRTEDDNGESVYVGRLSVIDDDEALLVDWRTHKAAPFYRATPLDRLGVMRRRHYLYDGEELAGYSDDVFDADTLSSSLGLRGEAAILAALDSPSDGHMKSVVATIQAEQDAVIRSPAEGALVVQGGPGTGKTVVALHRAAYLLYNQRAALAENGVLIVGPTTQFLDYISRVLPSLGETGVVSVTAADLYPGVKVAPNDSPEVAERKGRADMADLLAAAVADRQRRPEVDLSAWYGSDRVTLPAARLAELFDRAQRHRTHNSGADAFKRSVVDAFASRVFDRSFNNLADARQSFERSKAIRVFALRHWPTLTAEQALNDLLGSVPLLARAARRAGIDPRHVEGLVRGRTHESELRRVVWSTADVALLDELLHLLGPVQEEGSDPRSMERDEATEFELAEAADMSGGADDVTTEFGELFNRPSAYDDFDDDDDDDLGGLGFVTQDHADLRRRPTYD